MKEKLWKPEVCNTATLLSNNKLGNINTHKKDVILLFYLFKLFFKEDICSRLFWFSVIINSLLMALL